MDAGVNGKMVFEGRNSDLGWFHLRRYVTSLSRHLLHGIDKIVRVRSQCKLLAKADAHYPNM